MSEIITVIWGKLTEEQKRDLSVQEVKLREMNKENTFIADYGDTVDPTIHQRPSTGYINEKTQITNHRYLSVVEGIKKYYPDHLGFINPSRILFVEDTAWEKTDKTTENSAWKITLQKAPKTIQDMFDVDYIIKTRHWYTEQMSEAQEAAMIMSELLRIDSKTGAIRKLTSESYSHFTSTFGEGWLSKDAKPYPNVSEEHVELVGIPKLANGQLTFATMKVVEISTDEANNLPFSDELDDFETITDEMGDTEAAQ